ncbi:hypothetical protein B0I32_13315 [Nonomuraea fuscirosea]|uniref:Uncharacterized protein n=1 Tax=Nonomuraea fuscirosea TaxID=1291556 RepID=A0A2T0M4M2_9ACTN|nr:hypothetical protein B0I32_13315 [Nonomuraea fuscirosea]
MSEPGDVAISHGRTRRRRYLARAEPQTTPSRTQAEFLSPRLARAGPTTSPSDAAPLHTRDRRLHLPTRRSESAPRRRSSDRSREPAASSIDMKGQVQAETSPSRHNRRLNRGGALHAVPAGPTRAVKAIHTPPRHTPPTKPNHSPRSDHPSPRLHFAQRTTGPSTCTSAQRSPGVRARALRSDRPEPLPALRSDRPELPAAPCTAHDRVPLIAPCAATGRNPDCTSPSDRSKPRPVPTARPVPPRTATRSFAMITKRPAPLQAATQNTPLSPLARTGPTTPPEHFRPVTRITPVASGRAAGLGKPVGFGRPVTSGKPVRPGALSMSCMPVGPGALIRSSMPVGPGVPITSGTPVRPVAPLQHLTNVMRASPATPAAATPTPTGAAITGPVTSTEGDQVRTEVLCRMRPGRRPDPAAKPGLTGRPSL